MRSCVAIGSCIANGSCIADRHLSQRDHTRDHFGNSRGRRAFARHSRKDRELMRESTVALERAARRSIERCLFGEPTSGNDLSAERVRGRAIASV
jgi:hypothetical protein